MWNLTKKVAKDDEVHMIGRILFWQMEHRGSGGERRYAHSGLAERWDPFAALNLPHCEHLRPEDIIFCEIFAIPLA